MIQMEKQNETFKKHTSRHFLWNYLFYRYCLELKDPSDFTGLEYSISTQVSDLKIEWFPDNGPKDEGGAIEELVGSLKEKMIKMGDDVNSFLDKQTSEISTNQSSLQARIDNYKKKMLPEPVMDEPAPLEE